jgi:hypothetical protein
MALKAESRRQKTEDRRQKLALSLSKGQKAEGARVRRPLQKRGFCGYGDLVGANVVCPYDSRGQVNRIWYGSLDLVEVGVNIPTIGDG